MQTLLIIFVFIVTSTAAVLIKLFKVDGDFTLISKGHSKHDEIEGKVVWITGASRGIGEMLAGQFMDLGAKLILSARNVVELKRVKSELIVSGEKLLQEAVQKVEPLFDGSSAFERPKRKALEDSEEGMQATFNINVLGTINLTWLLAPYMLKRGKCHFVMMSSAAGKCPAPGQAMYSASKHALNGYFHTLCVLSYARRVSKLPSSALAQ